MPGSTLSRVLASDKRLIMDDCVATFLTWVTADLPLKQEHLVSSLTLPGPCLWPLSHVSIFSLCPVMFVHVAAILHNFLPLPISVMARQPNRDCHAHFQFILIQSWNGLPGYLVEVKHCPRQCDTWQTDVQEWPCGQCPLLPHLLVKLEDLVADFEVLEFVDTHNGGHLSTSYLKTPILPGPLLCCLLLK